MRDLENIVKEKHSPEDLKRYSYDNKNIISWYPFKKNAKILTVSVKSLAIIDFLREVTNQLTILDKNKIIEIEGKYRYIIIGEVSSEEVDDLLIRLPNFLEDDGKIFYSFENEIGLDKIVTGVNNSSYRSKNTVKEVIRKSNLNATFYNVFPNRFLPEVIFTNDYLKVSNEINYRPIYFERNVTTIDERRLFQKFIENRDIGKYANSFLVVLNKNKTKKDIAFVKYNKYREKRYNLITYYRDGKYYKKPNFVEAKEFLNEIIENYKALKKISVPIIDVVDEKDELYSEYQEGMLLSDLIRYRFYGNQEKVKECLIAFWKECSSYYKRFIDLPKDNIFAKFKIEIKPEKSKKLRYVEELYLDMIPQNMIVKGDKYLFFDQEWRIEKAPIEFLLYRAIKYVALNVGLNKCFIKDVMKEFKLEDCYDEFKKLENAFFESVSNSWAKYYNPLISVGMDDFLNRTITAEREQAQGKIDALKKTIDELTGSTSWKITEPMRNIVGRIKKF